MNVLAHVLEPGRRAWWRRVLRRLAYGVVAVFGLGFASGWAVHGLVSPAAPTQAQLHDAALQRAANALSTTYNRHPGPLGPTCGGAVTYNPTGVPHFGTLHPCGAGR